MRENHSEGERYIYKKGWRHLEREREKERDSKIRETDRNGERVEDRQRKKTDRQTHKWVQAKNKKINALSEERERQRYKEQER